MPECGSYAQRSIRAHGNDKKSRKKSREIRMGLLAPRRPASCRGRRGGRRWCSPTHGCPARMVARGYSAPVADRLMIDLVGADAVDGLRDLFLAMHPHPRD